MSPLVPLVTPLQRWAPQTTHDTLKGVQKASINDTELEANVLFHVHNSTIHNAQVQKLKISYFLIGCRRRRYKLFRFCLVKVCHCCNVDENAQMLFLNTKDAGKQRTTSLCPNIHVTSTFDEWSQVRWKGKWKRKGAPPDGKLLFWTSAKQTQDSLQLLNK